MNGALYFAGDDRRRDVIANRADLNGIDFLEVYDLPSLPLDDRQRTLFVHFINDPGPLSLTADNVRITGGERIRDLRVTNASIMVDPRSGETTRPVLVVEVDRRGDFSTYTLSLVENTSGAPVLDSFDHVLRAVDFSFKVNCPSDFDCETSTVCPPKPRHEPAIDYLARDFNSLRQLLLDRLASVTPAWTERNVADLGVTLVELFAYVGDQLSYRQDAVATEAYLGTARQRISVRRHARLVDYFMHDGCAARAWLQVQVADDVTSAVALPAGTQVLSALPQPVFPGAPGRDLIAPGSAEYKAALGLGPTVFETLYPIDLYAALNEIRFYTWGARSCCLPRGAVKATLRGHLPLQAGDFLLFREVLSPRSGEAADAAFDHRHVVKVIEITLEEDPLGGAFEPTPTNDPIKVTTIRWTPEDALPFPLCISAEKDADFGGGFVEDVSLAYGNLLLADHGLSWEAEILPPVPPRCVAHSPAIGASVEDAGLGLQEAKPRPFPHRCVARLPAEGAAEHETDSEEDSPTHARRHPVFAPVRYRPRLREQPLTQVVPLSSASQLTSAAAALATDPRKALPAIYLTEANDSTGLAPPWRPVRDLLNSEEDAREFVVEVDNTGAAYLRFGDGRSGAAVVPDQAFTAHYRVGLGTAGNVGANTLIHLVSSDPRIRSVTNPLPAAGGVEPETIEEVRQRAPFAFRQQQVRAVTPEDYAARATEFAGVQRAAGTLRWTGSWHTMFVSVDRMSGVDLDPEFERDLRRHLEPFRMAGVDLEIDRPRPVALEVEFRVVVKDGYFRSDIARALQALFTTGLTATGERGLFHPDNFTFGQTVYLSPWVAAAQSVTGVQSVEVITFQRRDDPGGVARDAGYITVGRLEIPVLENSPDFPERGSFTLRLEGGQ